MNSYVWYRISVFVTIAVVFILSLTLAALSLVPLEIVRSRRCPRN